MRCFQTARSIRTSCCGTVTGVSGLEPTNGGLSIYITAGQTYLANPTDFRATSAAVSLRIVKAMSGSPARGDWTGFESSPLRRFLRSRACPAAIFLHWSQVQTEAFGSGLTMG